MDKEEKELKKDIVKDAEKGEAISDKEDKDYAKDADKHTEDREKTIKDDAEKSEADAKKEDKAYAKLDEAKAQDGGGGQGAPSDMERRYKELDNKYVSRDDYSALLSRVEKLEKSNTNTGKDSNDPYPDFNMKPLKDPAHK